MLAAAMAWLLPELQPLAANSQITGRTAPNLTDLIAAVATGLAGSYGLARQDVSDVMPGVAIAISLVPPLAVMGVTAQAGHWGSARGAFGLFASNVMAMIVAGTIVLTCYGNHREARPSGFRRSVAYLVIATASMLILSPLALTTAQAAREQIWLRRAAAIARTWAAQRGYALEDVTFDGPDLDVAIEGLGPAPPGSQLLARLSGQLPAGTPVVIGTLNGDHLPIGRVPG